MILETAWDKTDDQRIEIKDLNWQKIPDGQSWGITRAVDFLNQSSSYPDKTCSLIYKGQKKGVLRIYYRCTKENITDKLKKKKSYFRILFELYSKHKNIRE